MEYILQLDPLDDITSMRSRIELVVATAGGPVPVMEATNIGRRRLLLVLPNQNKALRSLVNMKLLERAVQSKAVELGLVTDHPTVRDYAQVVGLKVFGSIRAAKRFGWIKADAPLAMPDQTMPPLFAPPETAEPNPLPLKQTRNKNYKLVIGSGHVGCVQQVAGAFLTALLAIALVFGVMFLWPQATVTIVPVAKALQTDLTVKGDPQADTVDFRTLTFPARVAQVEVSLAGMIDTIEADFGPAAFASGNVTFINRSDNFQTIPYSTSLATSSGEYVEFSTMITAELPGRIGASTTVPVVAKKPGPIGNVTYGQLSRFVNPIYGVAVQIINESNFSGGTLELRKVVVNSDKDRLRDNLIEKMKKEGLKRLEATLGEQEFISADTIQVIPLALTFREFAGDFSDTFSGEMQAVVRGTVVGGYNANRLALAGLEAQVPKGYKLDSKGLNFGAGEVLEAREGIVVFRIVASGLAVPQIDSHVAAQEIVGMSIGEAQQYLTDNYELATVPGVELQPAWLMDSFGRLPFAAVRINVVVKDAVILLKQ